jgi:hypothetical protein
MSEHPVSSPDPGIVLWVLPHAGTNGQLSTWGAVLAGAAPPVLPR